MALEIGDLFPPFFAKSVFRSLNSRKTSIRSLHWSGKSVFKMEQAW